MKRLLIASAMVLSLAACSESAPVMTQADRMAELNKIADEIISIECIGVGDYTCDDESVIHVVGVSKGASPKLTYQLLFTVLDKLNQRGGIHLNKTREATVKICNDVDIVSALDDDGFNSIEVCKKINLQSI